ncbi:MAG TPA: type II toxin-antitoxin system VapB family antitoxin, partial [Thermoanaerobaculia bacterium]
MKKKPPWRDPIVEKIHRFREEWAAKFDHDPEKMYQELKRLEQEDDGPYVTLEDGELVPVDPKDQTSWRDPIVEEVRKRGQEYAAKFDFDLHKMGEDLRRRQKERGAPVVSFESRSTATNPPTGPVRSSKRRSTGAAGGACSHTSPCVESREKGDDMATNLALDDSLIEEAVKVGNHRTKKEAVTAALQE